MQGSVGSLLLAGASNITRSAAALGGGGALFVQGGLGSMRLAGGSSVASCNASYGGAVAVGSGGIGEASIEGASHMDTNAALYGDGGRCVPKRTGVGEGERAMHVHPCILPACAYRHAFPNDVGSATLAPCRWVIIMTPGVLRFPRPTTPPPPPPHNTACLQPLDRGVAGPPGPSGRLLL